MTSFTISLEAARVNKKMTQAEMAKALGVHRSTVYNWERGKTSPNYKYLKKSKKLPVCHAIIFFCQILY